MIKVFLSIFFIFQIMAIPGYFYISKGAYYPNENNKLYFFPEALLLFNRELISSSNEFCSTQNKDNRFGADLLAYLKINENASLVLGDFSALEEALNNCPGLQFYKEGDFFDGESGVLLTKYQLIL